MNHGRSGIQLTSMAPVIGQSPRVLVLGSMPGEISLRQGEYYAHPRNRFWNVMERLSEVGHEEPYAVRIAVLKRAKVGLWDVLKHCERVGSLDASILAESEVPNDIGGLLAQHASIDRIVLNGKKAAVSYSHLVEPRLNDTIRNRVTAAVAPSTSPANARFSLDRLVESWRSALGPTA